MVNILLNFFMPFFSVSYFYRSDQFPVPDFVQNAGKNHPGLGKARDKSLFSLVTVFSAAGGRWSCGRSAWDNTQSG